MQLTRDITLDWNQIADVATKLPCGIVQFRILDYEEAMTRTQEQDGTQLFDKQGNPKVAKFMYLMRLEAVAPEEALGIPRTEYFVMGTDQDPNMSMDSTLYSRDNIGAQQLKKIMHDSQVPWSSSLVGTLQASIGAQFLMKIVHKVQKGRDGTDFVGVNSGRTYKLGEAIPQYIPCLNEACDMCQSARKAGIGAPSMPQGMAAPPPRAGTFVPPQPMAPPAGALPPTAPPMSTPPRPPRPTAAAPLPSPVTTAPTVPMPQAAPVVPPPVTTAPVPPAALPMADVAMPRGRSAPPAVAQAPVQAPVAAPAAQAPQVAPPSGAQVMACPFPGCGQQVAFADFSSHMAAHSGAAVAQVQGQFKQEA